MDTERSAQSVRSWGNFAATLLLLILAGCSDVPVEPSGASKDHLCANLVEGLSLHCHNLGHALTDNDPGGPGVFNGYSYESCLEVLSGSDDVDADGFVDSCERALAADFAPTLLVDPLECDGWMWDQTVSPARLAGEYFYLVQRKSPAIDTVVVVAYLPAYYRDCGSTYLGGAHLGDSELIALEVAFSSTTNHWTVLRAFLSAHCGKGPILGFPYDYYCRWYAANQLSFSHPLGAPRITVSANKHANYPSYNACFNAYGGSWVWRYEDCDDSSFELRFPIAYSRQNIGSRQVPLPWSTPCPTATGFPANYSVTECIWDQGNRAFKGWQTDAADQGAKGYGSHLATYLFL